MSGVKIGLEVHIYVATRSKLFCGCPSDFLAAPAANTTICHVCTGQPGAKPQAPNGAAIVAAIRLARALGAQLAPRAAFQRKHYFYPDSPSNYQRTSEPIATGGALADCPLTELHVEEDPGAYDLASGRIDYNRAGAPLIELVTEPEIASPAHARRAMNELRIAVGYLGIGRPEAGMKADCNVSRDGGARVEVKNVHGLRNVERALQHEIERQAKEGAIRETRAFDDATGRTVPLRAKETDADYRYLADPDLLPLDVPAIAARVPHEESPFARRARIAALAGVPDEDASPLLEEPILADLYENSPNRIRYQFLVRDLRAELDYRATTLHASGVPGSDLEALLQAREQDRITPQVATRLLRHAFDHHGLGDALAHELTATTAPTDDAPLRAILDANPKAVADYHAGKPSAINYLVGQAMRQLQGRADANQLKTALEKLLLAKQ